MRRRVRSSTEARRRAIESDEDETTYEDPRDYDPAYYTSLLARVYATRFVRSLEPDDFHVIFADPAQPSLFEGNLAESRPRLVRMAAPWPAGVTASREPP